MTTKKTGRIAPRNHVALNPLLKKGGVHEKTNSAKRKNAKRDLQKQVRAWRDSFFDAYVFFKNA